MSKNLIEVFNTYNVNILFTVAALPSRVSLGLAPMQPLGGGGVPHMALQQNTLGNSINAQSIQSVKQIQPKSGFASTS